MAKKPVIYVLMQTISDELFPVAVHAYTDVDLALETFDRIMVEDELEEFEDKEAIKSAYSMDGDCAMTLIELVAK